MFIALIASSVSTVFFQPHEEKSFMAHLREHNLIYTGDEYKLRLGIFLANARLIQEHNSATTSFTLGLNRLATLTPAEYRSLLSSRPTPLTPSDTLRSVTADPPNSFDYRTQGAVTGVKDQGPCGAWAFGAVAAQETTWCLVSGSLLTLSEQQLLDCVGCSGGLPAAAYDYVRNRQDGKFILTSDYPYSGACQFDPRKGVTHLAGYYVVKSGDESDLLNAVWTKGAASLAIDASDWHFELYMGGIYDEPACTTQNLNHGLCVVGWGVDGSTPYWIAKNSWGTTWGEHGYIRMSRNKGNQCGIATAAVIPTDELN
jgi:C1A family cysteine protease